MGEQKRNVKIMISILVLVILVGTLYSLAVYGIKEIFRINFGELSLALATIILAIFTYQLASYTYQLASVETEESKKERRRLRVNEQLEKFYSQLRAEMESFLDKYKTVSDLHKGFGDTLFRLEIKR